MAGTKKKPFCYAFLPQKIVNSSSDGRARHRNRPGVVDLVGRDPLMFAKVENGVSKSCQIFAGKTGKTQSWHEIFRFFEQDRLLCARVDIGVTEYPTKTAKEEEEEEMGLVFFFQKSRACAIPFSVGNLKKFGRGKTNFFGGV